MGFERDRTDTDWEEQTEKHKPQAPYLHLGPAPEEFFQTLIASL